MPGFFITFMMLAAAAAWLRYLSETRGPRWLIWAPAPALVVWLLTFVYGVAVLKLSGPPELGPEVTDIARATLVVNGERLTRVRMAAEVGQWAALFTWALTLGLTLYAFLRPTSPPTDGEEAR